MLELVRRGLDLPKVKHCDKLPPLKELVTAKTQERIERVHVPEHTLVKKKRPKTEEKPPPGPMLPSREDLVNMIPYNTIKSMEMLRAHVYYLLGDAQFLTRTSYGSPVQYVAKEIEELARKADMYAGLMAKNAQVPLAVVAPHLPVAVSAAPSALLTCFLQPALLIEGGSDRACRTRHICKSTLIALEFF